MQNLMPLNKYELLFRKYYHSSRHEYADRALTLEEFSEEIENAEPEYYALKVGPIGFYSKSLPEASYFTEQEDIAAVQHLRYMPAIYHFSEFFELECVLSGSVTCFAGDLQLKLTAGDILILAPSTNHAACTFRDDSIMVNVLVRKSSFEEHFLNLLPDNDLLRSFFENALYKTSSTPYLLFRTEDPEMLRTHIMPLLHECLRNSRYKNTALSSMLSLFFVSLLRKHEKDVIIPSIVNSGVSENYIFIIEYMQRNAATITLSHLASFFNYSERQIQRIIQTTTGMSFSENIKKIRLSTAADLLKTTDMSIQMIADHLGYYDTSSFRHAFRGFYGVSPNEYRAG